MKVLKPRYRTKQEFHDQTLKPVYQLIDHEYGLYSENYFNEMIRMERKRTERSKKPFILGLINIEKIVQANGTNGAIKDIASILFSSTREIDIKGWHKYNSIVGILLTEIGDVDIGMAIGNLSKKINETLQNHLDEDILKKVGLYFHAFPENSNQNDNDIFHNHYHPAFYLDLPKRLSSKTFFVALKRAIDIIGSIVGLTLFLPLLLVIPLLIKLTSKGPILFKQERLGQHGNKFNFLKFRTMLVNNNAAIHKEYINKLINGKEASSNKDGDSRKSIFKIKNDPRITAFGSLLRKSSLDEIPQFINVLKGEMSLVGPRPPIPYEYEMYDIWHRRRILEVRPGITGLWQIMGRSSIAFDEMVRLDIKYIANWSIWMDVKILLKTPWVVFTGKGAY